MACLDIERTERWGIDRWICADEAASEEERRGG